MSEPKQMRLSLADQRALYERLGEEAADALVAMVSERRDELVKLAAERAFESVGVHEYGDSTYWISDAQLREETMAELADAVFYHHIELARRRGDLPPA